MTEKIKRLIRLAKDIGAENLDVEDWDYLATHLTPQQWRRFIKSVDAETLAKTP